MPADSNKESYDNGAYARASCMWVEAKRKDKNTSMEVFLSGFPELSYSVLKEACLTSEFEEIFLPGRVSTSGDSVPKEEK
jgi:hypothetical protein